MRNALLRQKLCLGDSQGQKGTGMLFTFKMFVLVCVHDGRERALTCTEARGQLLSGVDSLLPALCRVWSLQSSPGLCSQGL